MLLALQLAAALALHAGKAPPAPALKPNERIVTKAAVYLAKEPSFLAPRASSVALQRGAKVTLEGEPKGAWYLVSHKPNGGKKLSGYLHVSYISDRSAAFVVDPKNVSNDGAVSGNVNLAVPGFREEIARKRENGNKSTREGYAAIDRFMPLSLSKTAKLSWPADPKVLVAFAGEGRLKDPAETAAATMSTTSAPAGAASTAGARTTANGTGTPTGTSSERAGSRGGSSGGVADRASAPSSGAGSRPVSGGAADSTAAASSERGATVSPTAASSTGTAGGTPSATSASSAKAEGEALGAPTGPASSPSEWELPGAAPEPRAAATSTEPARATTAPATSSSGAASTAPAASSSGRTSTPPSGAAAATPSPGAPATVPSAAGAPEGPPSDPSEWGGP